MRIPTLMLRRTLDLRHVPSPGRETSIHEAIAELEPGELVEILASEPHAVDDVRATNGPAQTDLLESSQLGTVFRFVLRKV